MGFMSINSLFRRRGGGGVPPPPPSNILPYYGVAPQYMTQEEKNSDFIKGLTYRGPTADRLNPGFSLNAPSGSGLGMFYAYPVEYGEAVFTNITDGGFQGGWDGAQGDPFTLYGPLIVPVNFDGAIVNFYLYQTDWEDLGEIEWSVT